MQLLTYLSSFFLLRINYSLGNQLLFIYFLFDQFFLQALFLCYIFNRSYHTHCLARTVIDQVTFIQYNGITAVCFFISILIDPKVGALIFYEILNALFYLFAVVGVNMTYPKFIGVYFFIIRITEQAVKA